MIYDYDRLNTDKKFNKEKKTENLVCTYNISNMDVPAAV